MLHQLAALADVEAISLARDLVYGVASEDAVRVRGFPEA
jgi:hypothetical protein